MVLFLLLREISDLQIIILILACSAWSRAKKPPIEIGDISKEDSMKYLIEIRNIDEAIAEVLYEMVGGRILELKMIFYLDNPLKVGISFIILQSNLHNSALLNSFFIDIKKQKLIEIEQKFSSTKLLKKQKYHKIGKRAINALLVSKEININIFIDFFENNDEECEEYQEVLGANVFAYHPSRDTVSFQSQSVKCYIQENASIFIKST